MLLVITGAGASFDCLAKRDVQNWVWYENRMRPPKAVQLFEPREEFMRQMPVELQGLATHLRGAIAGGAGLEEELERLALRKDEQATRELVALRFYLNDVIKWCDGETAKVGRGGNAYDALVRRLGTWSRETGKGVAYATFNYDRFLERAFATTGGSRMDHLGSYISNASRRLYKLHGSVGWVRHAGVANVPTINDQRIAIDNASALQLGPIVWEGHDRQRGCPVEVPAIAVPTLAKSGFEFPEEHLDALRKDLADVDAILVIGWRGAEAHFLQELSEHVGGRPVKALVANGAPDDCARCREVLSRAVDRGGRKYLQSMNPPSPLPFSDLVASGALREFLGAV